MEENVDHREEFGVCLEEALLAEPAGKTTSRQGRPSFISRFPEDRGARATGGGSRKAVMESSSPS